MPEINYGALQNDQTPEQTNELPAYMYAADNHNYGNGNFAITDPSTWGNGLDNAGKFVATAVLSGANSFYNSAVTVGNWMGADIKENDTGSWISGLDSDLGQYYSENKDAVDTAGFIMGSFVPGLGGVKLLNAGQKALSVAQKTGMIGGSMARITGLLTPNIKALSSMAAADIAQSSATFSAINSGAIKAIAAGYGQAAMESAAFEIAVQATSFKSPLLDGQDASDIAKNMVMGTAVGGVIGGAINHASTIFKIKSAVKGFNPAEKQFADTSDLTSLNPAQRIIARNDTITNMPVVPTADNIVSGGYPWAKGLLDGLAADQQSAVALKLEGRLTRLKDETLTSMANKNRMDFHELTTGVDLGGGDKVLANHLADMSTGLEGNQLMANMEGLSEIGRVNQTLKAEGKVNKFFKNLKADVSNALDEDAQQVPYRVGYVKLLGEGTGDVSFDAPKVLNLGDQYGSRTGIDNKIKSYSFKEKKLWDAKVADHTEAEARYLWADTAKLEDGAVIGEHDLPLLERAKELKLNNITVSSTAGDYVINTADDLVKHIQVSKQEVASELLAGRKAGTGITTEEIAKITNMRMSYLEGEQSQELFKDLYARQGAKDEYSQMLKSKGLYSEDKVNDFYYNPSYVKTAYDTSVLKAMDDHQVAGMAYLKAQQKLYQQGVDNVFAAHVSDDIANRFWHPGDDMMLKTNRFGSGPGLTSFANGGYHTPESWSEAIGSATQSLQKDLKAKTTNRMQPVLYKLVNNQEAAIEFESVNKTLQSTSEQYGLDGSGNAVPLKLLDYQAAQAKAIKEGSKAPEMPVLQEGAPAKIEFKTAEAREAWIARTELTNSRTQGFIDVRNAQGLEDMKDVRAMRPVRPDPKDYPYYAVVVDPTVTGVGHKSMIHAASPKELEAMISKVPGKYEVYKGDQLKEYFKAQGEFDYEHTLHENYIDADLKKTGVNNPFFIKTDPQKIAQSLLGDHLKSDDIFARELVNAKYEKEFSFLRQQGSQYTNTATSKYTGSYRDIENTVNNPYLNYVKTALNVSQMSEHPYLQGLNTKLDGGVSKMWNAIQDTVSTLKSHEDLDKINASLNKMGVKTAYYDAATDMLANHTAPKGVLTGFVSKANAMLSTLTLRLDPLNAINNAIGSTILYGTELKSFIRAMGSDDTELAGKLSGLLKMDRASEANLAGQATDQVTTAGKILQQAVRNWFDSEATTLGGVKLKDYYKANGFSTRLADQAQQMMEDLTLQGHETVGMINQKLNAAFKNFKTLADKGEVLTGNKYAEEFNRFISADSMRQLTDLGVQAGKITEQEALGYINTFVNRTQGNIVASQRPLMFQGAVGQAIGLFQTYQFNMMQQLFRHVAEGGKKDAAMLLGLQGTMYGMNGLPGFNYLNTHIVGTLSSNPQHKDLYSSTYGIAGKSVGDLLLYGLPSNMLRANLYSRGDINPRQVSIVPVNPVDIPFVNASMKFYDNVAQSIGRVANGAPIWQTLLQGIEHNGISRPLAGVAQTFQAMQNGGEVFSTTSKGSINGGNDLLSWATAARIAGGKPFDDALVNDAVYRVNAYKAVDAQRMQGLALAVKTAGIGNGSVNMDPESVDKFAARYAALGGKQQNFNKFMIKEIKSANTNQANAIMTALKNPMSQNMQAIMGGTLGVDGSAISNGMIEQ
jgi:hypothetical protein